MSGSLALATTRYDDSSRNLTVDLSAGDLAGSAPRGNIVSGGDVFVDGMSETLADTIFSGVNTLYGNALNFVKSAIGTQKENEQQTATALATAYNSKQATINNFKTYALYAVIGFVAWSYFKGK